MFGEFDDCNYWRVATADDKQRLSRVGGSSSVVVGCGAPAGSAVVAAAGDVSQLPAAKGQAAAPKLKGVPKEWIFPYILLACAWSPWSGKTPGQWKNLCESSGKVPKTNPADQLSSDPSCKLASPSSMTAGAAAAGAAPLKMNNDSGESSSRRKSEAAVKAENDRARKAIKDKENMAIAKESIEMKKKGVAAMDAANVNAKDLVTQMQRMVQLRERQTDMNAEEATAKKRKRKIEAVEKRIMLAGPQPHLTAQLDQLLSEECDS